jgi:hypothetical protein
MPLWGPAYYALRIFISVFQDQYVRDWVECSDTEYDDDDDDTTDSEEEWYEVKDYDLAWDERGHEE